MKRLLLTLLSFVVSATALAAPEPPFAGLPKRSRMIPNGCIPIAIEAAKIYFENSPTGWGKLVVFDTHVEGKLHAVFAYEHNSVVWFRDQFLGDVETALTTDHARDTKRLLKIVEKSYFHALADHNERRIFYREDDAIESVRNLGHKFAAETEFGIVRGIAFGFRGSVYVYIPSLGTLMTAGNAVDQTTVKAALKTYFGKAEVSLSTHEPAGS